MKNLSILALSLLLLACDRQATAPDATLEELRGQWVVINYWAQWCKPCIKEIPELNALDRRYDKVTVLGVNYDGASGAELEQQRQQLGVEFRNLQQDPAAQLEIARPVVLPTTLILDPNGTLVATLVGPQTEKSLAAATQQVMPAQ
jgi:thiol-disulfide isomerase/thioredoxin